MHDLDLHDPQPMREDLVLILVDSRRLIEGCSGVDGGGDGRRLG